MCQGPSRIRALAVLALPILVAPLAAVELGDVQIHGFLSQGYLHSTQTDWYGETTEAGSFEFSEAALNASARPLDGVRLGVQLLARDFGRAGENRVEIDWAFADWRAASRTGVKVGRIKMPYGLYNESRDLDFDHATVFLPEVIYLPQLRDYTLAFNGAMVYGGLDLGRGGQVDASVFGGGQNIRRDSDLAGYLTDLGAGDEIHSMHLDMLAGAALTWQTPVDGLRMRLSGVGFIGFESIGTSSDKSVAPGVHADERITTDISRFYSGIASIEYQHESLSLAAEYLREFGRTTATDELHPYTRVPGPVPGSTVRVDLPVSTVRVDSYTRTEAMYAASSYRIADRVELSVSRQLRFSDRERPGMRFDRSWALAGRYDILGNWLVKAEWQHHSGFELDTGADHPDTWTILALKTTVDF